jgi:hypothetical protein
MKPPLAKSLLVSSGTILLALTAVLPARADYSSTVSSFNPAAYWRLNETATVPPADVATNRGSAGPAATGYYLKGAVHAYPAAMAGSSAAYFTGGAWVRVPNSAALNPSPPFSVEFWINPNPAAGVLTCPLSSTDFSVTPRLGWLFYTDDGYSGGYVNGGYYFRVYSSAGTIAATSPAGLLTAGWTHVVGVVDGTNVVLYVNGRSVASNTWSGTFTPNVIQSIGIGTRYDAGFPQDGSMDDVAIYGVALSPNDVKAHYDAATTNAAGYATQILAANPAAYWRLDEPYYSPPDPGTLPVAANIGTLGTEANGAIYPGLTPGVAGPPFSGLEAGNHACQFSGIAGYIDCGASPGLDLTPGPFSIMAWIKVNRFDVSWQSIVTKGDSAWRVHRNSSGSDTPYVGFGTTGFSNVDQAGTRNVNDGQWHQIACVYDGATKKIYVDSVLDASADVTGELAANTYNVMIGENSQVTGRNFNGLIDEVAIFTNALSAAQIQQIFYAANVPPVIAQQPQAPAGTIIAGAPVSLSVVAVGNPILGYQWTKQGISIPDRTTATLSFSNITTNDAGNYAVVVTNAYGAVTSSVVALSVTYPAAAAALVNAVGYPAYNPATQAATLTQVILEFSGPLGAEGSNPTHYAIPGLTVSGAQFANLNQTVILTTSPQTQGAVYNLTITGVTDGVGQPLGNNTAQFRAWVASPLNGVRFEYYPSEATGNPPFLYTDVGALINNSLFPDYPVLATNLWACDSRIIFPDDTHESYGARMRGVFVPPSSGNYRFYLRSDDASQVFFNPNGPDAAGRQMILNETGCCGDWNKYASPAFPLVAGQSYYLEMLYKEGGGGDYGKVAALLEPVASVTNYPPLGTANTAIDPAAIAGPAIGYPYAPADVGGALTLIGPNSVTVQANHTASFSAVVSSPSGWPLSYQWRRNGLPIQDATGSSYTLAPTTADNNVRFTVQVFSLGSAVVSAEAILTVNAATSPPAVVAVHGSTTLNTLIVSFNELLSAPATGSFSIPGFTTTSAVLDATGTNVILTFFPALAPGQAYTLTVQNVQDYAGNMLASATAPVQSFVLSRGLLKFDYFGGLTQSPGTVADVIGDPRYPNKPDWTAFIPGFDSRSIFPDDSHTGYGDRITGVFVPPTNGNYIFYIKSDDNSQLFLNPNGSDSAGSTLQTEEISCCHGFSANSNSVPVALTNGQLYYLEAIHKEGGGGDYVQVATELDTDTTPPDNLYPMAPALVGVLADPIGASVTITQQPANDVVIYEVGPPPVAVLNANFNSNDGGFSVTNYTGPNGAPLGPWSYNAGSGSWTNFGPDGCEGPFASGLNTPAITLATNGSVVLTFAHRYSFEQGNWDLGQVRVSLNGGPFTTVPAIDFQQNGYNGTSVGTITPTIAASPGWINVGFLNESLGYSSGTFITSVAYLGSYKAGDTLKIQFLVNWDDCSQGAAPNWEIDSVEITLGGTPPLVASFSVGAESVYQNQPNPYMSYFWQRNTGSGFVDVPGTGSSPNLIQSIAFADSGNQFRCIVYGPGASATSAVVTVSVTVPLAYTRPTANTLLLSWPLPPPPAPFSTFLLEQSPTMLPGSWTTVPSNTYQVTSTTVSATVTIQSGQNQFYRLRRN